MEIIKKMLKLDDSNFITEKNDLNEIVLALGKLRKAEYKGPIVLEYAIDYIEGNKIEEKIIILLLMFLKIIRQKIREMKNY